MRAAPSKKRSAPMPRQGSVSSHQTTVPPSISSRRTEGLTRRGSQMTNSTFGTPASRGSVDSMHPTPDPSFQDTTFSSSFNDFMSFDLHSRTTPESTSTVGSSQRHPYPMQQLNMHNPVHKLDTVMFPSEDPFAYPNQPMIELGYPNKGEPDVTMGGQGSDPQFFLTGTFEDVDSQLFGQPPPYMVHQQGQQTMNIANQMYDPSMMGMSVSHAPAAVPAPAHAPAASHPAQHQHQHHHNHAASSRRAQAQRHHERQIQQMFTEQGMQPDWGSFFGSGRGGFQGM